MKIKFSTVVLFFFASAVFGSGVGYSKLYLFHVALVIFVFSFLCCFVQNGRQSTIIKPKSHFISFLYFMFFWYALGILWSVEPLYTLRYLFYIAVGISIAFIVSAYAVTRQRYLSLYSVLKYCFLLAIAIAFLESFTSFRLPTSPYSEYAKLFGRDATNFSEIDYSVHELIRSVPTSFWGNPNNFSVAMTLVAPFFLFHRNYLMKIIGMLSILLLIVMAGSRGAFLALVFGFFVFLFIKGWSYFLSALVVLFLSFSLFVNSIEVLKQSEYKRVAELAWTGDAAYSYLFEQEESTNSIGARQQLIQNGLNALWSSGGIGVGGGGSQYVQERLGGVAGKFTSMHNFWVEILVDAGFVFFSFFMVWYFSLSYNLYKVYKKSFDNFYRYQAGSLFVAMMTFLVSAVSASSVIYLLPMWLMIGMAIALNGLSKKEIYDENRIACSE
ncbi:Teichuronic acid biosynthesis protein TuaE [Halomonas sp. THAF5a]|nr:Teichuronic acid biosynthesis protein TuaE [Halomonas sp. THAF5a]